VFVDLNVYKQDFGDPAEREHKVCDIIDPETGKMKKAAFIPKRKAGYFEGELATTQKLQKKEVLDCDLNALRSGQVDESFDQHMESFAKSEAINSLRPSSKKEDNDDEAKGEEIDESECIELMVAMQQREDSQPNSSDSLTHDALRAHDAVHSAKRVAGKRNDFPSSTKRQGSVVLSTAAKPAPTAPTEKPSESDWLIFLKSGWDSCTSVAALDLTTESGGYICNMPSTADKAKWSAAVKAVSAQLVLIKDLLESGKIKDQEIKSAATQLKKIANGKCKKAGTKSKPELLSDRFKALSEFLLEVQKFRSGIVSSRMGSISSEDISKGSSVTSVLNKMKTDLTMGLEDADKAAAAELVKQAAQAIFLFPDNLEFGSPEENNAYGKLSDFFWFTKSEFSENVQQLQQKFLASALSHIFTTSPKDDYQCEAHDYAALLLCFLPQQDVMAKAVLDEHVGKYLVILGNLAGKVKSITGGMSPEDAATLSDQLHQLKISNVAKDAKLLSRFLMTPGYKKFALFLQAELSRSQQDQAATQRAKTLQTDVSEVNAILTGRTQVGPFTLMRLVDMVKTLQKLVEGIAALPMGESSQHKEIRVTGLSVRDDFEDCDCVID
ncbi:unnamed protein product, partial [Durusdinium trenchii]